MSYDFAIYMDDLSVCLTQRKTGCHLNETVPNHVTSMYAYDIAHRNCSTKMLNLCYEMGQYNNIICNTINNNNNLY